MIISRDYVAFRSLVSYGDEGGKIFMNKLQESYEENVWDEVWNNLADRCLYQREISWAFVKIEDVVKAVKYLDKINFFDDGLKQKDTTDDGNRR